MVKYKVIYDGEEEDDLFDSKEDAKEYALYLQSCEREGAEIMHMSNPGDYDYDEETFRPSHYRIKEVNKKD